MLEKSRGLYFLPNIQSSSDIMGPRFLGMCVYCPEKLSAEDGCYEVVLLMPPGVVSVSASDLWYSLTSWRHGLICDIRSLVYTSHVNLRLGVGSIPREEVDLCLRVRPKLRRLICSSVIALCLYGWLCIEITPCSDSQWIIPYHSYHYRANRTPFMVIIASRVLKLLFTQSSQPFNLAQSYTRL